MVKYKRGAVNSFHNMLNRHNTDSVYEDKVSFLLKEILELAHARTEFEVNPENADTILKFRTT